MGFFIKIFFYLAVIGVGAFALFTRSPMLKANMLEIINPRVKEARLLGELNENLGKLASRFSGTSEIALSDNDNTRSTNEEVIKRAKALVDEIEAINEENSGHVRNGLTRILDTLIPGGRDTESIQEPVSSVGPTPEPCAPI